MNEERSVFQKGESSPSLEPDRLTTTGQGPLVPPLGHEPSFQTENEHSGTGQQPGLGTRAARGAATTLVGQLVKALIQLASVVILARILSPSDYGLLAMVAVILGVADLFRDFGLSSAAIQAKSLSHAQRDVLFWLNSALGLLLAIIIFSAAPIVAAIYQQPLLIPITQALSITFLLNGISTQYRAGLNRSLRFRRLVTVDIASAVVGLGAGIWLASSGGGYWALVLQQLVTAFLMLLLVSLSGRWLPGRPRRNVPMNGMVRFGTDLVATQLIGYFGRNADTFIIGLRFGPSPLGLYNRAFQLLMLPLTQMRSAATVVALPVLARLQDEQERMVRFVLAGQLALGYLLVTGLGLVAGAAQPVTAVLLGEKWLDLVPILVFLSIAAAFQTLAFVGYWVYLSQGLTRALFKYSIAETALTIVCVVVGSQSGIVGVAAGYAVAQAINWPLSLWWLARCSGLPIGSLYAGAFRIMATAIAVGLSAHAVVLALHNAAPIVSLLAACAAAVLAVVLLALLVPPIRRDLATVGGLGRRALKRST